MTQPDDANKIVKMLYEQTKAASAMFDEQVAAIMVQVVWKNPVAPDALPFGFIVFNPKSSLDTVVPECFKQNIKMDASLKRILTQGHEAEKQELQKKATLLEEEVKSLHLMIAQTNKDKEPDGSKETSRPVDDGQFTVLTSQP